MAIVLKKVFQKSFQDLYVHSQQIIGVLGDGSVRFLHSLKGENLFYLDFKKDIENRKVYDVICENSNKKDIDNEILSFLKEWHLEETFLNKSTTILSKSERKILGYLLIFLRNDNIVVIEEPFLWLDAFYKNRAMILLKNMTRQYQKTIFIRSNDSNTIYTFCNKVLLISNQKCLYGDVLKIMIDKTILKDYNIEEPDIVKFVNLAREKGVFLSYSVDIRDLIKDVYKNVSSK